MLPWNSVSAEVPTSPTGQPSMRRLSWKIAWRPLGQRLCAGLTLLAYVCAVVGFPLPIQASHCAGGCTCCAEAKAQHQCCCCAGKTKQGKSGHDGADKEHSCCFKMQKLDPAQSPSPEPSSPDKPMPWSVNLSALHCQGLAVFWVSSGAATVAQCPLIWTPIILPVAWLSHFTLQGAVQASHPETPPPKALA